ncbi:MAG: sensor histidine kinase [Peptostreptococcaceae bacterium]
MDINSKILEDKKLINTLSKFRICKKIFNIILFILMITIMIFIDDKKIGITICLFLTMLLLILKNLKNDFKDLCIFMEIHEISNTCEDIVDIFEKTKNNPEVECFLGEKHRGILKNLYKVEKYIYSSILSGKQNENMLNSLIVDVSKKLKIPVNNIMESIDKLENTDKYEDLQILNELEKQSDLLKHNIEEVFELSKVVSGDIELGIQKIDIKNLLKQALIEYEDKLNESNLILRSNIEEDKLYINADGQQMWRVFETLLDNIVQYSKSNSRVYVNLEKNNEEINISLINVSKNELNVSKDEFLRLIRDESNLNKMGLAIAYNLVLIQNGNLEISIDGDIFKIDIRFDSVKETIN